MNVLFLSARDFNHPDIKHVSDLTREYLIDKHCIDKAELVIVQYKGESRIIKNRHGDVDKIPSRLSSTNFDEFSNFISNLSKPYRHINIEPDVISCLHDTCSMCHGTGVTKANNACIHMISCPCPKCTPVNSISYIVG